MPKDRSSRVASREARRQSRGSPYASSRARSGGSRQPEESSAAAKRAAEWEEVRCPVCMDHPHNAVLLVCSSHEKGCRPFMCDTSSRHSNCYDQYRKASKETSKDQEGAAAAAVECGECPQQVKLSCPLCRGPVSDCVKDYDARRYMNSKVRSCATEPCEFRGAYHELRKHARVEHPAARPTEVDPERQRDWRRMEQQRDLGDLISMLRSGFGGGEDGEEGAEVVTGRTLRGPSILVFIVRSSNTIPQYLTGHHRRTLVLLSHALGEPTPGGAGGGGGASAAATSPDGEEGDDPAPTTEASAEEEEADGDPAQ